MLSVLQEAKQQFIKELKQILGKEVSVSIEDLEAPPDPKLGDLAFPCFSLAKALKRSPNEIAIEIATNIAPQGFIKKAKADGPYVNILFNDEVFGRSLLESIHEQGDAYGSSDIGKGNSVMVEYAQPNTHKEIHVGHLRNFLAGQLLVNVLRANHYEVIPTAYIGDMGMHVAKCLWGIKTFFAEEEPEKDERVAFLGKVYVKAATAAEENEEVKKEMADLFRELDELKGPYVSLWKKTRGWSLDVIKAIYKELGLTIDVWYFESDFIDEARKIIADLQKKGIVVKSEGALIVDLEQEHLGVNLLVKTDGALLYNAKDIALALRKEEDFHPMRSINVIDARQTLAQKQLVATLRKMGFEKPLEHLSYEFVTTKEGTMASRKGNVILYEDLRDQMIALAKEETMKRHEEWGEKKVEKIARAIAFSAMRFGMLKQDLDKKIIFDLEEALSFEGFTGPYLLYTFARIQSILRKAKKTTPLRTTIHVQAPVEHQLLVAMAHYPEILYLVGQSMNLASLTQYLFGLCQVFSEYYHEIPVLTEEGEVLQERLAMVEAVSQVLKNGFVLLGMEPIEEM